MEAVLGQVLDLKLPNLNPAGRDGQLCSLVAASI